MKVLHVLGKSSGGIRQHVSALNAELLNNEIDSTIVGPHGVMDGLCDQEFQFENYSSKNPFSVLRAVRYLRILFRQQELIHAHGVTAAYLSWMAQLFSTHKLPIILTLHNIAHRSLLGKKFFIVKAFQSFIISRVSHVIVPTKFTLNQIIDKGNNQDKFSVVLPIGKIFNEKERIQAKDFSSKMRQTLSLSSDDVVFLFLGRIAPQKNLEVLLKAFDRVSNNSPDIHLVIAGSGSNDNEAKLIDWIEHCDNSEKIHRIKGVDSPANTIASADVMVLSSVYETVPLVVLEGLQLGVPTVMTQTGIAEEILQGEYGEYVPVGDDAKFSQAIQTWSAKVKENTIDHHKLEKKVDSIFNSTVCVQPIIDIYQAAS